MTETLVLNAAEQLLEDIAIPHQRRLLFWGE